MIRACRLSTLKAAKIEICIHVEVTTLYKYANKIIRSEGIQFHIDIFGI